MIRIFKHYISRWSLLLVLCETSAFLASVYFGVELRFFWAAELDEVHRAELLPRALFFAAVMLISMTATGRYQRLMRQGMTEEALSIGLSFIIGLVATSVLFYALPDLFIGRGAFIYAWFIALGLVLLIRVAFYQFIIEPSALQRRILIYGSGQKAGMVERMIDQDPGDRVIVGFWSPHNSPNVVANHLIYSDERLLVWCQEHHISEVVVAADHGVSMEEMQQLLDCKSNRILVLDLPQFFEREERLILMEALGTEWWIAHSDGIASNLVQEVMKKSFDILISLLLLFTLWPIMLVTALLIVIEGRGKEPVFYRQARVGYGGKIFHVIKFRSMRADAEKDGPVWAQKNDNRVTRVGRVIRNTRIDELPQFINVLRGEMSLVGPRPERPEFVELLQQQIPYYSERHRVKPGITGWAQIKYGYGASVEDAVEKLKYDLYYIKNHTLFFDLLVLIHSVEVVLFGKGADAPRKDV
ncbi:sugar transferase [Magnetococcus marinus MC-1]|uniref:Sugar transferase n=1 Tax=Magnetococcus marinus (strain ATCC BAA-1437 / JCM 17883 / MC-1) TaxID=156889 RepID=A0L561_MAGMM|nr:TIGR03013 family XrtA/PEP-CTERM system glycosyltransferase [Magnetococcus marinus]ABK43104.1 sugar transferase [Magnetococcus marinus MC-1]